ncbi:hypothetical protein N9M66_00980 [Litoreibacter sp.]|nr:hypothetical protein [Litoreibacter sp.]
MRPVTILHTTDNTGLAMRLQNALGEMGYQAETDMRLTYDAVIDELSPKPLGLGYFAKLVLIGADAEAFLTIDNTKKRLIFIATEELGENSWVFDLDPVNLTDWSGAPDAQGFPDLIERLNKIFGRILLEQPTIAPSPADPFSPPHPKSTPKEAPESGTFDFDDPLLPSSPMPGPAAAPAPMGRDRKPKSRIIGLRFLPLIVISILLGIIIAALMT